MKWRLDDRIGEYRINCGGQDDPLVVLALTIGHRREIYT